MLIASSGSRSFSFVVSPRAAHTVAISDDWPLGDALHLLEHAWVGLPSVRPAVFRMLGKARQLRKRAHAAHYLCDANRLGTSDMAARWVCSWAASCIACTCWCSPLMHDARRSCLLSLRASAVAAVADARLRSTSQLLHRRSRAGSLTRDANRFVSRTVALCALLSLPIFDRSVPSKAAKRARAAHLNTANGCLGSLAPDVVLVSRPLSPRLPWRPICCCYPHALLGGCLGVLVLIASCVMPAAPPSPAVAVCTLLCHCQ